MLKSPFLDARMDAHADDDDDDDDDDDSIPLTQLKQKLQQSYRKSAAAAAAAAASSKRNHPKKANRQKSSPAAPCTSDKNNAMKQKKKQNIKKKLEDYSQHDQKTEEAKAPDSKVHDLEDSATDLLKSSCTTSKQLETGKTNDSSSESESEEEEPACCLCHCGVDCSDRALFFLKDRKLELEEEEDYYFRMEDPYLPQPLYDRNNALVYCDSCNRLYHQKCHFVPLLVLPRGDWNCLICTSLAEQKENKKNKKCQALTALGEPAQLQQQLFTSPPPTAPEEMVLHKQVEQKWEVATHTHKAHLWHKQFGQIKTFLNSQLSNIRMAQSALETLTSTKRNRAHFLLPGKKSQELAQTLLRLAMGKWKIRQTLEGLEAIRKGDGNATASIMMDWCTKYSQHAMHVFPYGLHHFQTHQRSVPRSREMTYDAGLQEKQPTPASGGAMPMEIVCDHPEEETELENKKKRQHTPTVPSHKKEKNKKKEKYQDSDGDDDDSGITLDDLQCCICTIGDSTDENDVLLCDGQGCYRAFHMKCIYPEVTPDQLDHEDWFCPLCSAITNFIQHVQIMCNGEDDDDDHGSEESWEHVHDVFPAAEWEYSTAQKFQQGKQNDDTRQLMEMYLGDEFSSKHPKQVIGSDSEDEDDYSLFDDESFQERRQQEKKKEHADDDKDDNESEGSIASSEATLLDYSDIEYKVGKSELEALSCSDNDSDDSEDEDSLSVSVSDSEGDGRRKSRRLRSRTAATQSEQNSLNIGADFDKNNIIEGKRRRKTVDYRKLNDALFGQLSAKEKAKIDGGDDFNAKKKKRKAESDDESEAEPARKRFKKMSKDKESSDNEEEDHRKVAEDSEKNEDDSNSEDSGDEESGEDEDSDNGDSEEGEKDDERSDGEDRGGKSGDDRSEKSSRGVVAEQKRVK